jgi:hypothetical protein
MLVQLFVEALEKVIDVFNIWSAVKFGFDVDMKFL